MSVRILPSDGEPQHSVDKHSTAFDPEGIPQNLNDLDRWGLVRLVRVPGEEKPKKIAFQARYTGRKAHPDKPEHWCGYGTALGRFEDSGGFDYMGFLLHEGDGLVGLDYDDCRNPRTGEIRGVVMEEIRELGGYAEVSPSGTGVKVIARGRKPGTRCSTKETPWGGEFAMYGRGRYFALTGQVIADLGGPTEAQPAIDRIYRDRFPAAEAEEPKSAPPPGGAGGLSDEELVDRACKFRSGGRFRRHHFEGSTEGYKSRSEADFAHMEDLYWLTGDEERTVRLFMASALYLTGKGEGYVRRSVKKAAANHRGGHYRPKGSDGAGDLREKAMLGILGVLFSEEEQDAFRGQAGGTDHDVLCAVGIGLAEEGIPYKGGAAWFPGEDEGAKRAGVSRTTYRASLRRLAERYAWLEIVEKPRARSRGGVVVHPVELCTTKHTHGVVSSSCTNLHGFAQLLRLRWGRDLHARFQRVGKCAAAYLHWLVAFPDGMDPGDLAERTGRHRDDVVRYLRRLESNGLVEKAGPLWRLHPEFRSRLAEVVEDNAAGAERRHQADNERQKEAREHWRYAEDCGEDARNVPIDLDAERLFRAGWRPTTAFGEQRWARPGDRIEWVSREEALERLKLGERRPWSSARDPSLSEEHPLGCECPSCYYAVLAGEAL